MATQVAKPEAVGYTGGRQKGKHMTGNQGHEPIRRPISATASRFVASGRHFPKRGAQKYRDKK